MTMQRRNLLTVWVAAAFGAALSAPLPVAAQELGFDDLAVASRPAAETQRVAELTFDKEALYARLMAQERAEHSSSDHMSFLDRGLRTSPLRADAGSVAARLADSTLGDGSSAGEPMPAAGQMPASINTSVFAGMHPSIKGVCVVAGTPTAAGMRVRWYGRNATANSQFWSATKIVQAYNLAALVGKKRPDLSLDEMVLRPAGGASPVIPVPALLQDIVSYDAGVPRSNGGSEMLGRFLLREQRQEALRSYTGHAAQLAGGYGAAALIQQPELVTRGGVVIARAPAGVGTPGPNLVSAYDMARVVAMAAWHCRLSADSRIPGAQWNSLRTVMRAMGEDSARYLDVALQQLGLTDKIKDPVIATKLGFGISSASGLAELTYVGTLQFTDLRFPEQPVRRVCFALKGAASNAVALDARVAVEVTEIVRLLANGRL